MLGAVTGEIGLAGRRRAAAAITARARQMARKLFRWPRKLEALSLSRLNEKKIVKPSLFEVGSKGVRAGRRGTGRAEEMKLISRHASAASSLWAAISSRVTAVRICVQIKVPAAPGDRREARAPPPRPPWNRRLI
ncbi:hypothetical protein EVAR_28013_1 [Eumeta japonica]|uniref:Uncharacterized protein n=1 Tax=Eumeta variegata TaxID=151549 RepID=A0A4C1WEQ9_EUMVA|nr:hypothetical protein EVAR_28013_1 [Eumeta japonica]